jgi:ethanolamine utilization protein EutQ (cupin superfamily)
VPTFIEHPSHIQAAGNMPKLIDEYVGRVNNKESRVSIAHMRSPAGWQEPGQAPEFEEYTIVLRGRLHVRHKGGEFDVVAGQAVIAHSGEWIQYSTPGEATEYIAVCFPAFSPATVHRDETS